MNETRYHSILVPKTKAHSQAEGTASRAARSGRIVRKRGSELAVGLPHTHPLAEPVPQ